MATTEPSGEELQRAWDLHQRQQYDEAEAIYRRILDASPQSALALFLLGRLELEQGRNELAAQHLSAAVLSDASKAIYLATLAQAEQALGRINRAVGNYRQAIDLDPKNADYHVNLGNALLARKEATEAVACYKMAIELDPQLPEAHTSLGAVLEHQGQLEEAVALHRKAIELRPNYAEAYHNLGAALVKLDRLDEALECFRSAVVIKPDWDAPWANLGILQHALGLDDEARRSLDRALELTPRFADHHVSHATMLRDQGRLHEAFDAYERALSLDARNYGAWYGRALVNLSLGRFTEGWAGFEHRIQCHPSRTLALPEPRWDGSPLEDRTLLIHAEWTPADTIQFVRLVKLVRERNVVLAVQPVLTWLLAESGFQNVVAYDGVPRFDVQLPLMSLPRILQIELETIPCEVPYLSADPHRVARWRDVLAAFRNFKVGFAWQDARRRLGRARTISPDHLAALAAVPGVDWISLEEPRGEPSVPDMLGLEMARIDGFASGADALLDAAAMMKSLDLVIVSDSVLAHLAGALGVPVWVALARSANWRWLVDRDDSPWYPTMRLFRQETEGDWSGVFERMATALAEIARQRADAD
jgi:tetratricopeptide (TPR) repeat protein